MPKRITSVARAVAAARSVAPLSCAAVLAMPVAAHASGSTGQQPDVQVSETVAGVSEEGHTARSSYSSQDSAQVVLPAVADELFALGADAGFAGQEVHTKARRITAYWKNKAPLRVLRYVRSRPLGVTIDLVQDVPYSRAESMAAATALARSTTAARLGITRVSVESDGSGLKARVGAQALLSAADEASAGRAVGVHVRLVRSAEAVRPAATRYDDSPAWKGGARTLQGSSACSTGFSVLAGSYGRLLSAHHCDTTADRKVTDGAGQTIAPGSSSVSGNSSIDSQIIDPSASPATTPRVYTGAWNSGTTATVKNWARNWKGEVVCTSGATSGQHCGTITDDATTLPWASGSFYIEAQAANQGVMVAGGDSGGPVFATTSGGVQARGIILGRADDVSCGATNPDVSGDCDNNVIYAPISVLLSTWGVKLEVG